MADPQIYVNVDLSTNEATLEDEFGQEMGDTGDTMSVTRDGENTLLVGPIRPWDW